MHPVLNTIVCIGVGVCLAGCSASSGTLRNKDNTLDTSRSGQWPITGKPADELLAGILGTEFGNGLSKSSLKTALETEYVALEKGQTGAAVFWKGSGVTSGTIVPQQVYEVGSSKCRRYLHTITKSVMKRSATGTACRDSAGIWKPLV